MEHVLVSTLTSGEKPNFFPPMPIYSPQVKLLCFNKLWQYKNLTMP